jgi:hypothetical protein
MPRSRLSPQQKLIHAFLDLNGAEQASLIETFIALQRRGAQVHGATPGTPAAKTTRKPRKPAQPALPGTGA